MPAGYVRALDAGLDALGLALAPAARAAIDGHVRLLIAWNAAINLTAIRDPAEIAVRHVLDSLTAVAILRGHDVDRFVDLGSGGGYPGIALAVALPADRALLVDSIRKKVRFLATVIDAVGLADHAAAEAVRAEELAASPADRGRWPAVTARAVAPLADLIELGLPLLKPGGILVAWKRDDPSDRTALGGELATGTRALAGIDPAARMHVQPAAPESGAGAPAMADLAHHVLVVVERGDGAIEPSYPREPAARRRKPW